jgi:hypothetical protein
VASSTSDQARVRRIGEHELAERRCQRGIKAGRRRRQALRDSTRSSANGAIARGSCVPGVSSAGRGAPHGVEDEGHQHR